MPQHEICPYPSRRQWSWWRHAGPSLIGGWPWGHGALHVGWKAGEARPYICAACRRKRPAADGPLWFPPGTFSLLSTDDETVCADCARARSRATFDRCHLALPLGCTRYLPRLP